MARENVITFVQVSVFLLKLFFIYGSMSYVAACVLNQYDFGINTALFVTFGLLGGYCNNEKRLIAILKK
jgi:hypothetical protein